MTTTTSTWRRPSSAGRGTDTGRPWSFNQCVRRAISITPSIAFDAPYDPGTYSYAYRFTMDAFESLTYCDLNGAGSELHRQVPHECVQGYGDGADP